MPNNVYSETTPVVAPQVPEWFFNEVKNTNRRLMAEMDMDNREVIGLWELIIKIAKNEYADGC